MSQYSTGLVSTTNGSSVITGTSTAWLTSGIDASDFFIAAGDTVAYTIASIDSDTQITLTANYAGSTQSGITYTAHIERFGALPIFSDNDADTPELMNEVVKFTVNQDSALGTASTKDTGTAAGDVPLNSDLGSASLVDTGTASGDVPLNSTLVPKAGGTFTGDITYYGGGGVSSNTSYGTLALNSNTVGDSNTAHGYLALTANTTGSRNTASGRNALSSNTTGSNNTANGRDALNSNTVGNYNTAHGYLALSANTAYNNVSGLGHNVQVTGSDQVQLGNSNTTVYTQSGTVSSRSDLRDKADVRDTILGLDFITALRPVDYRWDLRDDYKPDAPTEPEPLKDDATEQEIEAHALALSQYENDRAEWLIAVKHENLIHDGTHKRTRYHHGVIAQEVAEVIAESGIDFGGYQDHKVSGGEDVLSIGYDELIGPLIKALQEVNQKFDALKEEFDDYVETHS